MSDEANKNETQKWSKKTVQIGGFTAGQREKEFERQKKKMAKDGWEPVEYNDEGMAKSNAVFRRPLDYKAPAPDLSGWGLFLGFCFLVGLIGALPSWAGFLVFFLFMAMVVPSPLKKKILPMFGKDTKTAPRFVKVAMVAALFGAFGSFSVEIDEMEAAKVDQKVTDAISKAQEQVGQNQYDAALGTIGSVLMETKAKNIEAAKKLHKELADFTHEAEVANTIYKLEKPQFKSLLKGELQFSKFTNAHLNTEFLKKMKAEAPKVKKEYYKRMAEVEKIRKVQAKLAAEEKKRKAKEAAAQQRRERKFGKAPKQSGWDGSYYAVTKHLEQIANDPGSIDISGCTDLKVDDKKGYVVGCDYRGKNAFGALIKQSNWFVIRHDKVVERLPASAYSQ